MSSHSTTAEEQFINYAKRLRDELDNAYTHYEIAKTLREFGRARRSDFSEATTFFQVTIQANLFAAVMTINRLIDKPAKCLQLHNFFKLVRKNLDLFSTPAFKKRLKDRGMSDEYVEDWARLHVEITTEIVDEDEAKVKSLPVTNLISWRHATLAHIDKARALNNTDIMATNPVTVKEIDDILTTLDDVLNRYSSSYDGVHYEIGLPPVKYQMEYIIDAIDFYRQAKKVR